MIHVCQTGRNAIDQDRLNSLIAGGLATAGNMLGSAYGIFRADSQLNPLSGSPVATTIGIFDADPALTLNSPEYRHANQALFVGDTSLLQAGDYLVGQQTWFVAHIEALRPASCVICNRTLTVSMPAVASATGANSYGGATAASDAVVASGWPASVLTKTHIEIDPTRLPSDTKTSYFEVLMPTIPGVELSFGLLLEDETGQNYVIAAAELSLSGWRLLAGIQTT